MQEFETDALTEQMEELVEQRQWAKLRELLLPMEPADIAEILDELPEDRLPLLYRLLPKELAAEVFVEMEAEEQELLIKSFSDTELKEVLDELYVDDTVDIVEEMPASVVKRILQHADPETRKSINEILKYPEDSAGSIMTTEFVDLKKNLTVADAIKRIRRTGTDKETINICYVTDPSRHLLGLVSIRTLLLYHLPQGPSVKHRYHMKRVCHLHGRSAFVFVHRNHLDPIALQFDSDFLSKLPGAAQEGFLTVLGKYSSDIDHIDIVLCYFPYLFNISPKASMRLSLKKGHPRLTYSVLSRSMSTTFTPSSSFPNSASISPWGPVANECPQNCSPDVFPEGSSSWPVLLTVTTGSPLATECPLWTSCHAPHCTFCSSSGSVPTPPMAVG